MHRGMGSIDSAGHTQIAGFNSPKWIEHGAMAGDSIAEGLEMASVGLERVYKRFGDDEVVCGIDLEIADGDFAVLVGPSGCGKSTVLRMIAGLETVTSGDVYIGGKPVSQLAARDRDVAMVFQSYALYPRLTLRENIGFGLRLSKLPAGEIALRVERAADIVGLRHLLDRTPKHLSGGQRQLVAMGRAIVRQPAVFLFDDPLGNMEEKLRDDVQTEIAALHKRLGTTVVYVTHDQVEASKVAGLTIVMDRGAIQQVGSPHDVYARPANLFVAGFIGSPAMNFLDVTIAETDGAPHIQARGFQLPLPDRFRARAPADSPLILGIRPEHISHAGPHPPTIRVQVAVIDRQGSDAHARCELEGQPLTIRLAPDSPARAGDILDLAIDLDSIHLFDQYSGTSLVNPT